MILPEATLTSATKWRGAVPPSKSFVESHPKWKRARRREKKPSCGCSSWDCEHAVKRRKTAKPASDKTGKKRQAKAVRAIPPYVLACRTTSRFTAKRHKKTGKGVLSAAAYLCGSWRCGKGCMRSNNAKLYKRLVASVEESEWTYAGTLTFQVPDEWRNADGGLEKGWKDKLELTAQGSWSRFIRNLKDKLNKISPFRPEPGPDGERVPFTPDEYKAAKAERKAANFGTNFRVIEWCASGAPHIHYALKNLPRTYFESEKPEGWRPGQKLLWRERRLTLRVLRRWLKSRWKIGSGGERIVTEKGLVERHGFGFVTDLKPVKSQAKLGSYFSAHLSKAYQIRRDYVKNLRRYAGSRDALPKLPEKESPYERMGDPVRIEKPMHTVECEIMEDGGRIYNPTGNVTVDSDGLPDSVEVISFDLLPANPDQSGKGRWDGYSASTVATRQLIEEVQEDNPGVEFTGEPIRPAKLEATSSPRRMKSDWPKPRRESAGPRKRPRPRPSSSGET